MKEENVTCPVCGESFIDRRGLTSHARHKHEITTEQLDETLENQEISSGTDSNNVWKIIGAIGVVVLTVLAVKKIS